MLSILRKSLIAFKGLENSSFILPLSFPYKLNLPFCFWEGSGLLAQEMLLSSRNLRPWTPVQAPRAPSVAALTSNSWSLCRSCRSLSGWSRLQNAGHVAPNFSTVERVTDFCFHMCSCTYGKKIQWYVKRTSSCILWVYFFKCNPCCNSVALRRLSRSSESSALC